MDTKNNYELILVLAPDRSTDEQEKIIKEIESNITASKGELNCTDTWGDRKLAYVIKNYEEGFYVLINFDIAPDKIKDLEKNIILERSIIRHICTKTELGYKKFDYEQMVKDDKKYIADKKANKTEDLKSTSQTTKIGKIVESQTKKEEKKEKKESSNDPVDKDFEKKLQDIIDGEI